MRMDRIYKPYQNFINETIISFICAIYIALNTLFIARTYLFANANLNFLMNRKVFTAGRYAQRFTRGMKNFILPLIGDWYKYKKLAKALA